MRPSRKGREVLLAQRVCHADNSVIRADQSQAKSVVNDEGLVMKDLPALRARLHVVVRSVAGHQADASHTA